MPESQETPAPSLLQQYLAQGDTPCPGCGYNLKDLPTRNCPECGDALTLRLSLEDPRLGLWTAGLIATACGLGFNILLLVYILIRLVAEGGYRLDDFLFPFATHHLVAGAVEAALLVAWLRFRPIIRRKPTRTRVALVAALWLAALINVAIFSAIVK